MIVTPGRILFVDDEIYPPPWEPSGEYMRYYLDALEQAGFQVLTADGPDNTLRILRNDRAFDLVLLDIIMPPGQAFSKDDTALGMRTGLFLASSIREMCPGLPLVVLTNSSDPDVHAAIKSNESVTDVLMKIECTPWKLVDEVRNVIKRKGQG